MSSATRNLNTRARQKAGTFSRILHVRSRVPLAPAATPILLFSQAALPHDGGLILRSITLLLTLSAILTIAPAHALEPLPSVVAVIDLGTHALVTWAAPAEPDVTHYDVYGVQAGQASYLGSVEAPRTAFVGTGGFDGYQVVAIVDGEARPVGGVCVGFRTDPPQVMVGLNCARHALNAQYRLP